MRFKGIWCSILAIMGLVAAAALYGQEIRGSIVGNVTDPTGAVVPGAQITVKNEGTGIEWKTATDTSGTYTVPDLLAGVYTVAVVKEGFKTYQSTGVRVLSSQTVRQDLVLVVGTVAQTVEVGARAQLVQTDSPTIGGTLQTRELADLPFMTTSTDGLFQLTPGMSQGIVHGNANPAIGGGPYYGSSNFTVNGVSTSNPGQGGGGNVTYIGSAEMIAQANLPSIDTLEEFKIDSSMNGAEYRSQTGVSMVTKQGTNRFHGQAYEFNENKSLSANSFDFNAVNEDQYPFNRNQFGGNVGGPILRDKLFFFVAYDGIREIHPKPSSENFPSQAMRNGDFSALCSTYDANGVCSASGGRQLYNPLTGLPFAGNQIPQTMITSQAKTLLSYMPLPNFPANSPGLPNEAANWRGGLPARYGTNNEQARLDGQLGAKDSVVAFFSGSRGLPWFYAGSGPANYGNWPDHGYNWLNFSGAETHTFGPGMINEFRVGWVFALRNKIGQNTGFQPWSIFPGMPPSASPDGGLPTVSLSGYRGFADQGIARGIQNTVDWVDNLTLVHGRHTIKAGFEETGYKEDDAGGLTGAPPLGSFTFNGRWTGNRGWNFGGNGQSAGNAFADFLLGYPYSTSYGVNTQPYLLSREWAGYVQDTWKASPRLTVNFGARYMYQRPWTYRDHNATFFDLARNKLVLAENSSTPTLPPGADPRKFAAYLPYFETTQSIGAPLGYFHGDTNNWAPRVGFAYRLSNDNKTVIRGGYGVYYAFYSDWQGWRNLQSNVPWGATNSFRSALPGTVTAAFLPDLSFDNAFPTNLITGLTGNPSVNMWDQNPLNPATQQWNLTLERQMGENWSFRGTYLGSQTHHLLVNGYNINFPNMQDPQNPQDAQAQVLLQPWSSINYWGNGAKSAYHQLQMEVQKRFAHGLFLRAEYDWTRDLTNGDPNDPAQNPHDLNSYYGNDPYQFRHRFLVYYIYELPVGRGRKWLSNTNKFVDGVLGGWRVSGITTYHSGDPFGIYLEDPGTEDGAWLATLMDRVPGPLYAGRQSGHDTYDGVLWFNTAAFAPPPLYHWGNSSPNLVFGPGFGQWDFSVMKSFRLPKGESNRLEFKVDFFNLPNHYNLGDPNNYLADTRDGGEPDPTAGYIYGGANAYQPRTIQIGLRLFF